MDGGLQNLGEYFGSVDIDYTKALYLYQIVMNDRKKEQYKLYLRENRDKLGMSRDAIHIYEDAF